ncbi:uncharacterized protein [Musca autumnalis]|uniref:uncharacterized protein n=1 Tax=Musca autumnalis TaxID=221902 RepID=UPI003CFA17AF
MNYAGITSDELAILKIEGSDWNTIKEIWKKSHHQRQNELRNNDLSTNEYIQKYNVLSYENALELLQLDVHMLYPSCGNIYIWKQYYQLIVAKAEKINEHRVFNILRNIDRTEVEDSKLAQSFMLIPYILPAYRKKSKLECQESFIYY